MMSFSVSSPRPLRPRHPPERYNGSPAMTDFNIDPTASTLGYAGGEEATRARENEQAADDAAAEAPGSAAAQTVNAAASTTSKLMRGVTSSLRRTAGMGPKGILKNSQPQAQGMPVIPPPIRIEESSATTTTASSLDEDGWGRQYQRRPGPPLQSELPQSPEPTLEGTTLLGHDPHMHYRRPSDQPVMGDTPRLPANPRIAIADATDLPTTRAEYAMDYKKMPGEFYTQPLLTYERIKAFFLLIHNLPWISTDRITVDYYPGRGTRVSTGISDLGSLTASSSAASSPSFSGNRRRPVSSWFMGQHAGSVTGGAGKGKATGSKRGSLDLMGSLDSVPVEEIKPPDTPGSTMYTPLAGYNNAGMGSGFRAAMGGSTGPPSASFMTPQRSTLLPLSPTHNRARSIEATLMSPASGTQRVAGSVIPPTPTSPSRTPRTPFYNLLSYSPTRRSKTPLARTPRPVITNALSGDVPSDSTSPPIGEGSNAPVVSPTPVLPSEVAPAPMNSSASATSPQLRPVMAPIPVASLPFRKFHPDQGASGSSTTPRASSSQPRSFPQPQSPPSHTHTHPATAMHAQPYPAGPSTQPYSQPAASGSNYPHPVVPKLETFGRYNDDDDEGDTTTSDSYEGRSESSDDSGYDYVNSPGYGYGYGNEYGQQEFGGGRHNNAYQQGAVRSRNIPAIYAVSAQQQQSKQQPQVVIPSHQQTVPGVPQGPMRGYATPNSQNAARAGSSRSGSAPPTRAATSGYDSDNVERIARAAGHRMFNSPQGGSYAEERTIDGGRGYTYGSGFVDR